MDLEKSHDRKCLSSSDKLVEVAEMKIFRVSLGGRTIERIRNEPMVHVWS